MNKFLSNNIFKHISLTKKITLAGILVALSLVTNALLEFKILDTQFSLTILTSFLIGCIAGPLWGFAICFLGDLLGYLLNSGGQLYLGWVGLSTGLFAFISGLLFCDFKNNSFLKLISKACIYCILTFLVCTVIINSGGFYLYNSYVGFSPNVISFVSNILGGESVTFLGYVAYRLFFKCQIFNSVLNYILIFAAVSLIKTFVCNMKIQ